MSTRMNYGLGSMLLGVKSVAESIGNRIKDFPKNFSDGVKMAKDKFLSIAFVDRMGDWMGVNDPDLKNRVDDNRNHYRLEDVLDDDKNPTGIKRYSGPLGDFEYDSSQFRLEKVNVDSSEYGFGGSYEILHYIGEETDGSKIKIPEGLVNGTMMFMNTNLESVPDISGVKYGFAMFAQCPNLTDASFSEQPLPELADMRMMFANCPNLKTTMEFLPKNVKWADGVFAGCSNLTGGVVNMRDNNVLKSANLMYAGTKVKGKAVFPDSCRFADQVFLGVEKSEPDDPEFEDSGLKVSDNMSERSLIEEKKKVDNKKSIFSHVSNMFGTCLQICSMKMAYEGRTWSDAITRYRERAEDKRFDRSFLNGVASFKPYVDEKGWLAKSIVNLANVLVDKRDNRRLTRNNLQKEIIDDSFKFGTGTDLDRKAIVRANLDFENGIFEDVTQLSTFQRMIINGTSEDSLKSRENLIDLCAKDGQLSDKDKESISQWYIEKLSALMAYYGKASALIDAKGQDITLKQSAAESEDKLLAEDKSDSSEKLPARPGSDVAALMKQGLGEVVMPPVEMLLDSWCDMQDKYQFMSQSSMGKFVDLLSKVDEMQRTFEPIGASYDSLNGGKGAEEMADELYDDIPETHEVEDDTLKVASKFKFSEDVWFPNRENLGERLSRVVSETGKQFVSDDGFRMKYMDMGPSEELQNTGSDGVRLGRIFDGLRERFGSERTRDEDSDFDRTFEDRSDDRHMDSGGSEENSRTGSSRGRVGVEGIVEDDESSLDDNEFGE